MKLKVFLVLLLLCLVGGGSFVLIKAPEWKQATQQVLRQAKEAQLNPDKWAEVVAQGESLPDVYPFTHVQAITKHAKASVDILQSIQSSIPSLQPGDPIPTKDIDSIFAQLETLEKHVKIIIQKTNKLPKIGLNEDEKQELNEIQSLLEKGSIFFTQQKILQRVYEDFKKDNKRALILLQNQNEPRSTGGFVGSLMLVDFTNTDITWKFSDIYALDRQIPESAKKPSPDFFAQINPVISLRDANMYPNFATSGQEYIRFFNSIEEKTPDTIIGINMNIIKEMLAFTGPIYLEKWNITANTNNFDVVLSFLVEAKISGRFNVKDPVLDFAKALLNPSQWENIDIQALTTFDLESFLAHKNIQAYSETKKLQRLFQTWGIDGHVQPHPESDNFLQFDFVSVGANKTEKFMWTKLWHDSKVLQSGKVLNSLEIQRRHNVQPGELDRLLGVDTWFENIRDQLNGDIRWTLAEGQNRTVLRVSVPTNAKLITQRNPSGDITETFSSDGKRKVFIIPMYVSPGEKNTIHLTYETSLRKGSHNWRPYVLQLLGTPGRAQTSFLQTISSHGKFTAETLNIGRPVELVDQDFRAVIDFR